MDHIAKQTDAHQPLNRGYWRYLLILLIVFGSLVITLLQTPFAQDQHYHNFADSRSFLGVPNFGDVASNLGFLIAGLAGLKVCFKRRLGNLQSAWLVMFAGIALVGVASSYYHWTPNDHTLVWDRMSLTVGFMGLFVGLLGEYISERFRYLLIPAVLMGVSSVLYWKMFQDLRFYYWIQAIPLIVLPFIMLVFRPRYSHQWLVLAGAILYGLAKLAELGDKSVFSLTQGAISGHTIKHTLAAVGCWSILLALENRQSMDSRSSPPSL